MEIPELFLLSDEELYAKLGELLLGKGQSFGPENLARQAEFAKSWLEMRSSELRRLVCSKKAIKYVNSESGGNDALEAAAIVDLLMNQFHEPAAIAVAVIIARRGLKLYCKRVEL